MNEIKTVIAILTVSFIVYGIVLIFTPAGNMGKFFKSVTSVFLIAIVILTVSNADPKFDFNSEFNTDVHLESSNFNVNSVTKMVIESDIKAYLLKLFAENGVSVDNLSVLTNISDDGSISINKIVIESKTTYFEGIKDIMENENLKYEILETDNE